MGTRVVPRLALFAVAAALANLGTSHAGPITVKGDPNAKCGGGGFTGTEFLYSATDPKGSNFVLNCINRTYGEGTITDKVSNMTYPFGRCVFDSGVNVVYFIVDPKKEVLSEIAWANIAPGKLTQAAILDATKPKDGESLTDWSKRVRFYAIDNKLRMNLYDTILASPGDAPDDQEITVFSSGMQTGDFILTPSEANADYLSNGSSPISALQIDPAMGTPGSFQVFSLTVAVPEPSSLVLAGIAALGGMGLWVRRRLSVTGP